MKISDPTKAAAEFWLRAAMSRLYDLTPMNRNRGQTWWVGLPTGAVLINPRGRRRWISRAEWLTELCRRMEIVATEIGFDLGSFDFDDTKSTAAWLVAIQVRAEEFLDESLTLDEADE